MTPAAPLGTEDWLPDRGPAFRRVEETVRHVCGRYGYREIRTPIFEQTALFERGVGDATDIVEKEMFTFGGGGESEERFSLRPEMTAPTARALIQYSLHKQRGLNKLFYFGPAFRRERPQKGRFRQFHQFGVEAFGSADPLMDVETILLLADVLGALQVRDYALRINSIGCGACRGAYRELLRREIQPELDRYCENCRRRFERNAFRILDCKEEACRRRAARLPAMADSQCGPCREHFAAVRAGLERSGLPAAVDPRIVRGLDYYTRTVYEFTCDRLGAQDALGGGGRYDGLVASLGGPEVPGVGFAAGVERIVMVMQPVAADGASDFFVVTVGPSQRAEAFALTHQLRRRGFSGDMDFEGRSVKGQMRAANVARARFVLVLGPDEAARGTVRLKDMADGTEVELAPAEAAARMGGTRP
jgi:histidyl-tRNA synthetase